MKVAKLNDLVNGWFVGDFIPTIIKTNDVEVAVKYYKRGDKEESHFHKISTEVTVVCYGRVLFNGKEYSTGDIVIFEPYESTDFEALEDSITTVVKYPGAKNDKYKVLTK